MHKKTRSMGQIMKFSKINLNDVKGVLLDLDNTLYDYEACHIKAIKECYSNYQNQIGTNNLSFDDFHHIYRNNRNIVTKRLSPQGACRSRLFAFQKMFEEFNLDKNWELSYQYEKLYWSTLIDSMILTEDASIFLNKCKGLNLAVCIVSDMTAAIQIKKLQKLGVADYIKYLVTSEEIGVEKPDPKIFLAALSKLKLKPDEVIMAGDSEIKDIKGAESLGIKSYRILIGE